MASLLAAAMTVMAACMLLLGQSTQVRIIRFMGPYTHRAIAYLI